MYVSSCYRHSFVTSLSAWYAWKAGIFGRNGMTLVYNSIFWMQHWNVRYHEIPKFMIAHSGLFNGIVMAFGLLIDTRITDYIYGELDNISMYE